MALPVSLDSKSTALWTWTLAPPPDFLPLPFPPFFIFAGPARSDHSSATAFLPSVASPPPRSASAALATSFPHDARAFWRSEGRDRSQGQGRRRAKKVEVTLTFLMSSGRFPLKTSLRAASAPSPGALVPGPARPFVLAFAPMIAYHSSKRIHHHGQPRAVSPFPPRRFREGHVPGQKRIECDFALWPCECDFQDGKSNAENQSSASASASRTRPGQTESKRSGGEEREEGTARAWPAAERVGGGEERVPSRAAVTSLARKGRGVCARRAGQETRRDETRRGTQKEVFLF